MSADEIHTLLAALDDYEQVQSDLYEATGNPIFKQELDRTADLYRAIDKLRFEVAA